RGLQLTQASVRWTEDYQRGYGRPESQQHEGNAGQQRAQGAQRNPDRRRAARHGNHADNLPAHEDAGVLDAAEPRVSRATAAAQAGQPAETAGISARIGTTPATAATG